MNSMARALVMLAFPAWLACARPFPAQAPETMAAEGLLMMLTANANATPTCATRGYCYFYESATAQASANIGGIAVGDSMCASDAGRPAAATNPVKAFLVGGTVRRASVSANAGDSQIDWVLLPSMQYRQPNGSVIGTTGANRLFTFPLTTAFVSNGFSYKTGLNASWQNSGGDCGAWATTSGNQDLGNGNATNTTAIAGGTIACTNPGYYLLCVEQ